MIRRQFDRHWVFEVETVFDGCVQARHPTAQRGDSRKVRNFMRGPQ